MLEQVVGKVKQVSQKMHQWLEHKDKVTVWADKYRLLLADPTYKEVLEDLFRRKVAQRTKQISEIQEDTADKTALRFVELNAERRVYENLLNNPEKYIREDIKIQAEEAKRKEGEK